MKNNYAVRIHVYHNVVLSLNKFVDYVDDFYPIELEIMDTADTAWSAPNQDLNCNLEIDHEDQLRTKFYDK